MVNIGQRLFFTLLFRREIIILFTSRMHKTLFVNIPTKRGGTCRIVCNAPCSSSFKKKKKSPAFFSKVPNLLDF